jgi:hypothetical protein
MEFTTLRSSLLLFGLAFGLAGCDASEPASPLEVTVFEDGVSKDTEGGAFRVVLNARGGLEVGANALSARVGFHDPGDPTGPGYGVPSVRVHLDAYPIDGEGEVMELDGVHVGDGRYLFEDLDLSDPGAWQFDFTIGAGETIDESVSFAFQIDG